MLIQERHLCITSTSVEGPFVEAEDESPAPATRKSVHPILAPSVSPSFTQVTTPERSIDGGEQHSASFAEGEQSSAEPVVMESARSPYGCQVREAFPVTAYNAATRGPSGHGDQAGTDDSDSAPLVRGPEHPGMVNRLLHG